MFDTYYVRQFHQKITFKKKENSLLPGNSAAEFLVCLSTWHTCKRSLDIDLWNESQSCRVPAPRLLFSQSPERMLNPLRLIRSISLGDSWVTLYAPASFRKPDMLEN